MLIKKWLKEANDDTIKKIVSGIVAILALVIWTAFSYFNEPQADNCTRNCVTEFSSSHRR
jgi:hypothetical protein